jgi:hypothetical protein
MKIIAKIFFIIGFLLASLLLSAQSKSDKIYDTFANKPGITNFTFTKNMIDAIDLDFGEDGDERNVSGDLKEIRFISYNPEKGQLSGDEFIKKAISMLPRSYEKYEDEDNDSDTEIWLFGGKESYKECHLFVKNENGKGNRFIVSFYGDFKVNDLSGLKKAGKDFSE